jgi:hypothetical protein
VKGEAKAKVSEPGGQERVTDENGDFGGRYRASEAERYSRKSGVSLPDSTAMRRGCTHVHLASEPRARQQQVGCRLAVADAIGVPCRLSRSRLFILTYYT